MGTKEQYIVAMMQEKIRELNALITEAAEMEIETRIRLIEVDTIDNCRTRIMLEATCCQIL